MNFIRTNLRSIILCLFELIVGALLMINANAFISGIIIIAGCVLVVIGITCIIKYFRTNAFEAPGQYQLMLGLGALIAGGFCAGNYRWFIVRFSILTTVFGIAILIASLSKIQLTVDMFRLKNPNWKWAAVGAAISLVFAAIILGEPFGSTNFIWKFTGGALIVQAAADVVSLIKCHR